MTGTMVPLGVAMDSPWLMEGDCLDRMKEIPDASVDAIITDPPYPCIKRKYGYWTEEAWHIMMRDVVTESRRVLKPKGSAVFILQPNSERVGRMRPWLWEFMAWAAKEWNQVQDVWWWNKTASPTVHCRRKNGLMRPSLKASVWLGEPDCFRYQDSVLIPESKGNVDSRKRSSDLEYLPSGQSMRRKRCAGVALERGGATPFNLLPIANADSSGSAGSHGHGAGTPSELANWWLRYITKPSDVVCDPFMGSGTIPLEAMAMGRKTIGIEKFPEYFALSQKRITDFERGIIRKTPKVKKPTGQATLFD